MKKHCIPRGIKQPEPTRCPNGFTLIEVMITMAIASFILAAAFTIFANYSRTNTVQTISADIQQDIRAGISFLEQEIRSAGLNPRELSTGIGFTNATSSSFTFTSDNDFNGLVAVDDPATAAIDETVTSPDERITYTYNAATRILSRTNLTGTVEVLRNIAGLSFVYRGVNDVLITGDPVPTASLENIRSVNIDITLSEAAGQYGTVSRGIQSQVYCRNLNL